VLFSSRAPIGYCVIATNEVSTNQGFKSLVLEGSIDPGYVRHYLLSAKEYAESKASGTTFRELSGARVAELALPVAPLPEQRRIVGKVDGLTARTARARKELDRIPTLIARYKQRLLALAFSGKLTAAWRGVNCVEEPKSTTFEELIDEGPSNGWSPPSTGNSNGALSLKLTATTSGKLRLDDAAVKRVDATPPADSKFWLRTGDMLIQRANSLEHVGATAIFEGPDATYIYPDLMMRVRVEDAELRTYLWRYLNSDMARSYFKANATGTAGNMPKINGKVLRSLPLMKFAKAEQAEIVRRIESVFGWLGRMAADHAAAARLLPKLDAAILAKAFRGELVPQDPNDEPASVLMGRIKAEREKCEAGPKRARGRPRKQVIRPAFIESGSEIFPPTVELHKPATPRNSSMTKSRQDDDVKDKPYLAGLLNAGRFSDAQSLFRAADLPVADFYKQLAWEIDEGHIVDSADELKAA
jgi:type I restriction enzyme S subunit